MDYLHVITEKSMKSRWKHSSNIHYRRYNNATPSELEHRYHSANPFASILVRQRPRALYASIAW